MRRLRLRALAAPLVALAARRGDARRVERRRGEPLRPRLQHQVSTTLQNRAQLRARYTYEPADPALHAPFVEERPRAPLLPPDRRHPPAGRRRPLDSDLEFHVEVPIVLSSNPTWHYAYFDGESQAGKLGDRRRTPSTPMARPCASRLPSSRFAGSGTVYHGGGFGDLKLGLAWGILSDARDDTKPFWLVGVDFTFPTAQMYDPGAGRTGRSTPPRTRARPPRGRSARTSSRSTSSPPSRSGWEPSIPTSVPRDHLPAVERDLQQLRPRGRVRRNAVPQIDPAEVATVLVERVRPAPALDHRRRVRRGDRHRREQGRGDAGGAGRPARRRLRLQLALVQRADRHDRQAP